MSMKNIYTHKRERLKSQREFLCFKFYFISALSTVCPLFKMIINTKNEKKNHRLKVFA